MQSCFPVGPSPIHILFSHRQQSAGGKGGGSLLCGVTLLHHPHQAQMSASHKGLALLILIFSSSSLRFIHGNHSKCTVPSPDPTEVSDGAPVDPSGAGV